MTHVASEHAELQSTLSRVAELRDTAAALVTCLRMVRRRQKRSREELETDPAHLLGDAALLAAGQVLGRPRSSRVVQFATGRGSSLASPAAPPLAESSATGLDAAVLAAGGFERPDDLRASGGSTASAPSAAARSSSTSSSSASSTSPSSPEQGPAHPPIAIPSVLPPALRASAPAAAGRGTSGSRGGQRSDSTACTLTRLPAAPASPGYGASAAAAPRQPAAAAASVGLPPAYPPSWPASSAVFVPAAHHSAYLASAAVFHGPHAAPSFVPYHHGAYAVPHQAAPTLPRAAPPTLAHPQAAAYSASHGVSPPPAKRAADWAGPRYAGGPDPAAWLPSVAVGPATACAPTLPKVGSLPFGPTAHGGRIGAIAEVERRMRADAEQRARHRSVGPGGKKWIKGRMSEAELRAVDGFVERVETAQMRVRKGDLAREIRQFVNPGRPPEFFEKLVSRRSLNDRLAKVLAPRASRKAKREAAAGVTALAAAAEALEARREAAAMA